MSPLVIAAYLGQALAYALAASAVLMLLGRLAGARLSWAAGVLILSVCFVIFLGLSPFPDPRSLDCGGGGLAPRLKPLSFLDTYARLRRAHRPLSVWLTNVGIISPIMNVVFFAPVGAALARLTRSLWIALALACGLTAFIELSQMSALYGLYPCPYRTFDVDDLILNVTGVLLGFLLWRAWAGRRGAGGKGPPIR